MLDILIKNQTNIRQSRVYEKLFKWSSTIWLKHMHIDGLWLSVI